MDNSNPPPSWGPNKRNSFWHRRRHQPPIQTSQTSVQSLPEQGSLSPIPSGPQPPIHERPLAVNPQSSSPLFNGVIPPEIRDQIFHYAVAEMTKTDPSSLYPKPTNYTRPGYTGKRFVSTSLLLTCRRAYLETYHLPLKNKEHVFWHARWPPGAISDERDYFARFEAWQMKFVTSAHLFTQMYWLEDSFPGLCRESFMQGIEKVKITIRRGDWWYNERNEPLGINPQRGGSNANQMKMDWETESQGQMIQWQRGGWGCAFAHLSSLQELEIEFETSEDKKTELLAIVEKAKTWRFPLKDNKFLTTEGMAMSTNTWQGPLCYWSNICPYCLHDDRTCGRSKVPLKGCAEKRTLKAEGLGPECIVVSLRWKVSVGKS
jgi:hypothetical protein